jgi:acyl-CoA thioesterase YciA
VAVNEFIFKQPVRLGDILSFYSKLVRVGRTSVTVMVEVFAERFRAQGEYIKVTQATFTYVAIDDNGRPRPHRAAGRVSLRRPGRAPARSARTPG